MKEQDLLLKGAQDLVWQVREVSPEKVSFVPRVGMTRGNKKDGCSKQWTTV